MKTASRSFAGPVAGALILLAACRSGGAELESDPLVQAPAEASPRSPAPIPGGPPVLQLKEVRVPGAAGERVVRFAAPQTWASEKPVEAHSVRLVGPAGEGEITVLAALQPSELGPLLNRLRTQHPGAAPSPPEALEVAGIDPERGERATQFLITGAESGEMVMIEREGVIVLYATVVQRRAWPALRPVLARCYSTVEVAERAP